MNDIVLYSLPTCPKCAVIRKKLDAKGIQYTVNEDEGEMIAKGITSCPMLEVDG